jgi:hypothetical protein
MSDIPANARKYIKQVRANRQKQKQKQSQKQSNKQSTTVIINPETKRKRGPNKPKSASTSGGGGGPSVIPYVIPQTQLSAANYQNSATQPDAIQQLTQALNQFQATPVYRNPFRMEPFRTAMNPTPLRNEEAPLPQPAPSPPPPVREDMVEEQNYVIPVAEEIPMSNQNYQGMSPNQSRNQLAGRIQKEVDMLGEYNPQTPTFEDDSQDEIPIPSSPELKETQSQDFGQPILSLEPPPLKKSGKGRPFAEVTPFQQHGIELYIIAREQGLKGDRKYLASLSQSDKEAYDAGRLLVTAKNRNNNPYVAEFISMIEDKFNK